MQVTTILRGTEAFQQPVSSQDITAMCLRAFGQQRTILSVQKLDQGEFNTTYLVFFQDGSKVVLRVAPSPRRCVFWHEQELMRQELHMQPFLAPIAPLLPRILMSDFTHQIIDRDYMFQEFKDGENWLQVNEQLSAQEHAELWRQFGLLVKSIATVQGKRFGQVHSPHQSTLWSQTVIDWLKRSIADARKFHLDTKLLAQLLSLVGHHISLLDEIRQPQLMHGDLWLCNLLIDRQQGSARIVGVLDADRGAWGDPLADWTFFLLPRKATPQEQELFWQGYGRPEWNMHTYFRALVYEGLHHGKILSVARRDGKEHVVRRSYEGLKSCLARLQALLSGKMHPPYDHYMPCWGPSYGPLTLQSYLPQRSLHPVPMLSVL